MNVQDLRSRNAGFVESLCGGIKLSRPTLSNQTRVYIQGE